MTPVRIVTDSASDLSAELALAHDITIVPLSIRFGSDEFVDGVDLSIDEFWAKCAATDRLPETSAPSPGAFQEAFTRAANGGADAVVCLTLSSDLSGTWQSARTAALNVADRIPVTVVDTRSVTMGQGLAAISAAELAASGAGLEEVVAHAEGLVSRTKVYGVVDTLDHLERGGRIGSARALLGSLLSIKPVVQVLDGIVAEESKQRTRARSLRYLADKTRAAGPYERIAVSDGAAPDLHEFVDQLRDVPSEHPLVVVPLGPVVGTHTGPGTIGVSTIRPL